GVSLCTIAESLNGFWASPSECIYFTSSSESFSSGTSICWPSARRSFTLPSRISTNSASIEYFPARSFQVRSFDLASLPPGAESAARCLQGVMQINREAQQRTNKIRPAGFDNKQSIIVPSAMLGVEKKSKDVRYAR